MKTIFAALLCTAVFGSAFAASITGLAYKFPAGFETLIARVDNTFTCEDKPYGFYADTQNGCQIFHVCSPVFSDDGQTVSVDQFSFLCGNTTIFNQQSLTCTEPSDSVPCDEAPNYYDSVNSLFGKILKGRKESTDDQQSAPSVQPNQGQQPQSQGQQQPQNQGQQQQQNQGQLQQQNQGQQQPQNQGQQPQNQGQQPQNQGQQPQDQGQQPQNPGQQPQNLGQQPQNLGQQQPQNPGQP